MLAFGLLNLPEIHSELPEVAAQGHPSLIDVFERILFFKSRYALEAGRSHWFAGILHEVEDLFENFHELYGAL